MQNNMNNILIYAINIVSFIVTLFSLYFNIKRFKNISELPTTIISKSVKEKNLERLTQSKYVLMIFSALNLLNLFLPNGFAKFIIPAISIVVTTNLLLQLFEEIDTFNVTKGEVDLISEFKQKQRKETLQKAKNREIQRRTKNNNKD